MSFDYTIDVTKSLLWRHNNAINLQALITNKQAAMATLNNDFWNDWYNDVFNIDTANVFGLSVWAIILNLPITVVDDVLDDGVFGFSEDDENFDNGSFSSISSPLFLNEDDARIVLKLRAIQLVIRPTVTQINAALKEIFSPLGEVYVLDGLDMTMRYVFLFTIPSGIFSAIETFDLLPRPSTVELTIVQNPNSSFGFGEFRKNFDNAPFGKE